MKKSLFVATIAVSMLLISACGNQSDTPRKSNIDLDKKEKKADYVVNIDESFDSGVELDDTKKTLSPEESDFRNLKWGMTKEEVSYAQGTGYREPDENTMYYTRLREEDFPADAEYTFKDGKLVQGIFYISQDKKDSEVDIDDFAELVSSLKSRFGEPQIADYVYVDPKEKTEDKQEQLELIKNGKLQLRTGWMLDDTELRVVMFPRNSAACIGLQYKQAGVELPAR